MNGSWYQSNHKKGSAHFYPDDRGRSLCNREPEGVKLEKRPYSGQCKRCKAKFAKWYQSHAVTATSPINSRSNSVPGTKQQARYEHGWDNSKALNRFGKVKDTRLRPCVIPGCENLVAKWIKTKMCKSCWEDKDRIAALVEKKKAREEKARQDSRDLTQALRNIANRKAEIKGAK